MPESPFGPKGAATWNEFQKKVRDALPEDLATQVIQIQSDFCSETQNALEALLPRVDEDAEFGMADDAYQKWKMRLRELDPALPTTVFALWGNLRIMHACVVDEFPEYAQRMEDPSNLRTEGSRQLTQEEMQQELQYPQERQ